MRCFEACFSGSGVEHHVFPAFLPWSHTACESVVGVAQPARVSRWRARHGAPMPAKMAAGQVRCEGEAGGGFIRAVRMAAPGWLCAHRRVFAAEVALHHRMHLFALAAPLAQPPDHLVSLAVNHADLRPPLALVARPHDSPRETRGTERCRNSHLRDCACRTDSKPPTSESPAPQPAPQSCADCAESTVCPSPVRRSCRTRPPPHPPPTGFAACPARQ